MQGDPLLMIYELNGKLRYYASHADPSGQYPRRDVRKDVQQDGGCPHRWRQGQARGPHRVRQGTDGEAQRRTERQVAVQRRRRPEALP
ncbi:MAG: hypothetical protein Q4D30_01160 [Bacteroidales bacterium]|nr:hypothetical protein [Bacteroidales bacterium]